MVDIAIGSTIFVLDNARVSKNDAMTWHIAIHITIGGYQNIANGNLSNNRSINTNPHTITNGRYAFSFTSVLLTDSDTFVNVTILSNNSICIDGDTTNMSQVETWTDVTLAINIDMVFVFQFFETPTIIL